VAAGRTELDNDLARALMNKGNALAALQRLGEALAAYDAAIAIRQRLVAAGRTELDNDLAAALMNKGLLLETRHQTHDALECYSRGIAIREKLFRAGAAWLAADLIKGCWIRFDLCRQTTVWELAAGDVQRALLVVSRCAEAGHFSAPAQREWSNFIHALRRLSSEERQDLFAWLGANADTVRRLIEGSAEG
jgi:tetratricopeptide (TPR) repeat protein